MGRLMTPEYIAQWNEAERHADDARNRYASSGTVEALLEWAGLQEQADRMGDVAFVPSSGR